MNAKFSAFDICVEVIIYLLLYNLYDWTFKKATRYGSPLDMKTFYTQWNI